MLEQLLHYLEALQGWVNEHPGSGVFVFAGAFLFVQLFMLPVSPLGMAAGLFFGFWKGLFALSLGCFLGATVNFFLVRWFARDFVRRKLAGNEKFRIIDTAIAREGWRIVALLRFVPIPFGLANYCYGLTPIRYLPYIAATSVAIIPANSFFTWLGSTFNGELSALVKGRPRHPMEYVFLALAILAAALALRMVAKSARSAVARGNDVPVP